MAAVAKTTAVAIMAEVYVHTAVNAVTKEETARSDQHKQLLKLQ